MRGDALGPLDELGFYEMTTDAGRWIVGTSLASRDETLLGTAETDVERAGVSRGWPPHAWLLLLAIVVLVAESLLYHRRKVG